MCAQAVEDSYEYVRIGAVTSVYIRIEALSAAGVEAELKARVEQRRELE